jgi:hypothetical protein
LTLSVLLAAREIKTINEVTNVRRVKLAKKINISSARQSLKYIYAFDDTHRILAKKYLPHRLAAKQY